MLRPGREAAPDGRVNSLDARDWHLVRGLAVTSCSRPTGSMPCGDCASCLARQLLFERREAEKARRKATYRRRKLRESLR